MTKKDAGPGYLKAEDMIRDGKWQEYTLTIREVIPAGELKAADGTVIDKPVICFTQTDKRFICGDINRTLIVYAVGTADLNKWAGGRVTLLACKGNWFGQPDATALRVKPPPAGKARPRIKKANYGEPLTGVAVGIVPGAVTKPETKGE